MKTENYEITGEKRNFLVGEISTASLFMKIIIKRFKNKFGIEVKKTKKIYGEKDEVTYELAIVSGEINEDLSREIDRDISKRPWQKMYFSSPSNREFVCKTQDIKFDGEKLVVTFYF